MINFSNTGPFSSLKCADELDIFFFSRGGMSWHLYTPVGPLKNHPTGAFYSSNGSSRHQSLKDKCASSLALTPGICRRFFLRHPSRRFIILSKFHHFILRDARFLGSFSLLLSAWNSSSSIRSRIAKLLSTSRSNVWEQRKKQASETRIDFNIPLSKNQLILFENCANQDTFFGTKNRKLPLQILYKEQNPTFKQQF